MEINTLEIKTLSDEELNALKEHLEKLTNHKLSTFKNGDLKIWKMN